MKNKWILFGVAILLMAINLLNADFSAFKQLSPADFLPVTVITLVSFLGPSRTPVPTEDPVAERINPFPTI